MFSKKKIILKMLKIKKYIKQDLVQFSSTTTASCLIKPTSVNAAIPS